MNKKDPIRWMNVNKEDDDRVTFVADCKSIVMSRDELTYNKELIQVNSIYFSIYFKCSKNPWSGFKLGMFCLTDSNIKYFSVEKSKNVDVPYSLWFVPSLW
jgi:DNA relaxase NicK